MDSFLNQSVMRLKWTRQKEQRIWSGDIIIEEPEDISSQTLKLPKRSWRSLWRESRILRRICMRIRYRKSFWAFWWVPFENDGKLEDLGLSILKRLMSCFAIRAENQIAGSEPKWTSLGFNNRKIGMKKKKGIKLHEESLSHLKSMLKWSENQNSHYTGSIDAIVGVLSIQALRDNRQYMQTVGQDITLCAVQGLPLEVTASEDWCLFCFKIACCTIMGWHSI